MLRRAVALLFAFDAFALSLVGAQVPPVFRVEARIVVVHAAVRAGAGEMVTDLDRSAFTVFENGKPQPIALFLRDEVPVSLGIVIDNSGSMRLRRTAVEAAALAFANASNPLDELFVVNFADKPRIDVPLTRDVRVLEAGIGRIDSIGGTAVRDAVSFAATYLNEHATHDRRVLLLITDGKDNGSTLSKEQIEAQAEQSGITVCAIGLPHDDAAQAVRARRALDELAEKTGGLAVHLANMENVESTAVQLARYVRRQYTLGYTPLNQALDGSYRRIRVAVKGSQKLSVRTRTGYYATGDVR